MCIVPEISTSNDLFKEIEILNNNASVRSTNFEQILVGRQNIFTKQNAKCLKVSYMNINDNDEKDTNNLLSLNLV